MSYRRSILRLAFLASCLAAPLNSTFAGTITFNPATTNWYLDVTIDVSNGYVQAPASPQDDWRYLQYDGIYDIVASDQFGWSLHATYGTAHNSYTSLTVVPPPGYDTLFLFIGDIYVEQWYGPVAGFISFHNDSTSQLWADAWSEAGRGMPVWTEPAANVSRLTWNLPDGGTTSLLLGFSLLVFAALGRRKHEIRSANVTRKP